MKPQHHAVLALLLASCAESAADPPPSLSRAVQDVGAPPRFTLFESGQVRPLALAPNGRRLYAVNTPDDRLEIFDVTSAGLQHVGSVPVGLEPVAVAARSSNEVWVVNHLSDSISIVDVKRIDRARVVRTLLVGDEPRDIVFAGPQKRRAFITTAHRGQNSPIDPQPFAPGVGRADVWAFDAENLGGSLGGSPLGIVTLFTDTPRALAVSPDGSKVYAAGFETGNRTTTIHELVIPDGGEGAGGLPLPNTDATGAHQPETGLIVKFDGAHWRDTIGRVWDSLVMFSLPDRDVFTIDAMASPPRAVASGTWSGVGTVLYNVAVNPVSGKLYVANTEAQNQNRFEGPGIFAGSSVRGHLHESRISVLGPGTVAPRHLNKHIDYATCCAATPSDESSRSLAFPQGMAVSSDGATLYVAAFGSSKVGIFSTSQLEDDTFVPSTQSQIDVSGGGPSGLALDEGNGRLYVMTRFDNSISVVDVAAREEIDHLPLYNPEPDSVVAGRRFLYDAAGTSSHGDSACASCHVFADFDSLAWDLGNPDGTPLGNPNPLIPPFFPFPTDSDISFQPMKGPMVTQSLRGMANHGPMHWRGDRTGGNDAPTAQPDSGAFDEDAAFRKFNVAFVGLLGRDAELPAADMQKFTDFILQVVYPPNPIRRLDNSLTADQQAGHDHFFAPGADLFRSCNDCHTLDPTANAQYGVPFPGFFGTSSVSVLETFDPVLPQAIKIPHLRNLYQKVGMFGMPPTAVFGLPFTFGTPPMGDQVRGFGYTHDGAFDNLDTFMSEIPFSNLVSPNGFPLGPPGQTGRLQVAQFLLAFDSNLAPIVGQQITLTSALAAVAGPRIDLLVGRAGAHECELVARGNLNGVDVGFLYDEAGRFVANRRQVPPVADADLRRLATSLGVELTYTCVPTGSGRRLGIDADLDGDLDGDEEDAGSDPRDPTSRI